MTYIHSSAFIKLLTKYGNRKPIGKMRKLNSGVVGIDHGEVIMFSGFEDDGQMWRGNGPRKSNSRGHVRDGLYFAAACAGVDLVVGYLEQY
jgi:hypothetical protein